MRTAEQILLQNAPVFQQDRHDSTLKTMCIQAMNDFAREQVIVALAKFHKDQQEVQKLQQLLKDKIDALEKRNQ